MSIRKTTTRRIAMTKKIQTAAPVTKVRFTAPEDKIIWNLKRKGKTTKEVTVALVAAGFNRTQPSVTYRYHRVVSKVTQLSEISYPEVKDEVLSIPITSQKVKTVPKSEQTATA